MHNVKKSSYRFFIYGYYGYGNFGDNLLLSALIDNILDISPRSEFVIRNLGPVNIDKALEKKVTLTGSDSILLDLNKNKIIRFIKYIAKTFSKIRECNCFIFGGGTLLHATTSLSSLVILATLIALARSKKINVYGVGIGAMDLDSYLSKFIVSIIISLSKEICVRDEHSLNLLPKSKKLKLTSDLVYSWLSLGNKNQSNRNQQIIAVTLWSTPLKNELPFLKTLATAIANFNNKKIIVRLLVFQHGDIDSGGLSDLYSLRMLDAYLKDHGVNTEYIQLQASKNEIPKAFDNVNIHIGARYHANVLSSILQIPFIGIDTEPKIFSLCSKLGMPTIQLSETCDKSLHEKIIIATHSIFLPSELDNLCKLSKSNYDLIKKEIEEINSNL